MKQNLTMIPKRKQKQVVASLKFNYENIFAKRKKQIGNTAQKMKFSIKDFLLWKFCGKTQFLKL